MRRAFCPTRLAEISPTLDADGSTLHDTTEPATQVKRSYSAHGTTALRKALVRARRIDKRTRVGKALAAWGADLVRDLGGPVASVPRNSPSWTKPPAPSSCLIAWTRGLLSQPSIVNA
jgi:hypothetical protein